MKKLILFFVAIAMGFTSVGQTTDCGKSGPSKPFRIIVKYNAHPGEMASVTVNGTSTASSNIIGTFPGYPFPGVDLTPAAFLGTSPCFTLGFIRLSISVRNANGDVYKGTSFSINNVFYYDYPLVNGMMQMEYTIPSNVMWWHMNTPDLPNKID